MPDPLRVRAKEAADQGWIEALLGAHFGGVRVALHGRLIDASRLRGLVAGEGLGLATYDLGAPATLVTPDAVTPRHGIGTALLEALVELLRARGIPTLAVTTTNDNLDALRFYQRHGFRIVAVHPGAITDARRLKPTIPELGAYGIPLRDEIDLELDLGRSSLGPAPSGAGVGHAVT